jgi:hypothetical protein
LESNLFCSFRKYWKQDSEGSACGTSCAHPRAGVPDELHLTILRVAYPTAGRWPRAKPKVMPVCQGCARQYDHATRPRGYDYSVDTVHSKDLESRRADYRSMNFVQQIFTASIIWLCRGGEDNVWLGRVPCTWLAAEALQFLGKTICGSASMTINRRDLFKIATASFARCCFCSTSCDARA